jgi:arginine/serine-rich splicing factor 4/5/6
MPATVFIGDLPDSARQRDIEDFFRKHGKIEQIRLRNRFGFVDFRSSADADDAVRDLDGEKLCGERIRLEISDGRGRRDRSRDRGGRGGGYGRDGGRGRSRSRSRGRGGGGGGGRSKPHRTRFTLEIENLSSRVK